MPYMYSEMQNKLSKTRESPLESMGQIISSRCPERILPYMGVAAILVMRSRCHENIFVPPIQGGFTYNLALIGPALSEKNMFEHCERRRRKTPDGRRAMGFLQAHL